ncbi:MAG: hypothetical protein ACPL1Z_05820 [Candidatus Bathyarchaeales archaeon]
MSEKKDNQKKDPPEAPTLPTEFTLQGITNWLAQNWWFILIIILLIIIIIVVVLRTRHSPRRSPRYLYYY